MAERRKKKMLYNYEFSGIATVSVTTTVEAESEEQARGLVECGDCIWECDSADGEVSGVELSSSDEDDDD